MNFDATFWVAVSFFLFVGVLLYFKVPQKIFTTLDESINKIKKDIEDKDTIIGRLPMLKLMSGFSDDEYSVYGAEIKATAANIFESSEMIVKVKEPQKEECSKLTKGQILFTYLHLAADEDQTQGLIKSKATAFAYETVTDNLGNLPLLAPMSEVAGRLAPQMGAWALQKANGGAGKLLSGAPGVNPTNVLIIGAGVVGTQAALIASGMGAKVTLMDKSLARLKYLDEIFFSVINTLVSA